MSEINSRTSLYCLIGYPVRHSLSPLIQNALFRKYKFNAVYLAFEVHPSKLQGFFQSMQLLEIKGCNLTLPHKIKALSYLNQIAENAQIAGSVNTVLNKEGRLIGYNTDVFGIQKSFEKLGLNVKGKTFLVLGAGGASRAVLYFLAEQGASRIYLANRTYSKALKLKNFILKSYRELEIKTLPLQMSRIAEVISEVEGVVNATSVGIRKGDPPILDPNLLKRGQKVFDLTYSQEGTALVRACAERRIRAIDGIPMLIFQALKSFELWTGIFPQYEFIQSILRAHLRAS